MFALSEVPARPAKPCIKNRIKNADYFKQVLVIDSPISGSSNTVFSRTEKTKNHTFFALQQLPGPYSWSLKLDQS
jgi:hypothetical protein